MTFPVTLTPRFASHYNLAVKVVDSLFNTLKIELTTCLKNKILKMHLIVLVYCCYSPGRCAKYETCAKLHRFQIFHLYSKGVIFCSFRMVVSL